MNGTLSCTKCSNKSKDIQNNPKAWDGWQIVPPAVCPQCIERDLAAKGFKIVRSISNGKRIETLVFRGINS
jgi:hypothetical protein